MATQVRRPPRRQRRRHAARPRPKRRAAVRRRRVPLHGQLHAAAVGRRRRGQWRRRRRADHLRRLVRLQGARDDRPNRTERGGGGRPPACGRTHTPPRPRRLSPCVCIRFPVRSLGRWTQQQRHIRRRTKQKRNAARAARPWFGSRHHPAASHRSHARMRARRGCEPQWSGTPLRSHQTKTKTKTPTAR